MDPAPSTERQDSLLRVGIGYHDSGRYAEAIAAYESILKENPDNVLALFEMSYSCMAKGDHERALSYARLGLKYRSEALPLLYMNEGSALEKNGHTEAFAYHIFRSTGDKAVATWLKFNDPEVKKLVQWDGEYAWRK